MQEASQLTDTLSDCASSALRSLQFGDLVHQVADHGEETAALLGAYIGTAQTLLVAADAAEIERASMAFRASLPRRLVEQQDLDGGDVIMF